MQGVQSAIGRQEIGLKAIDRVALRHACANVLFTAIDALVVRVRVAAEPLEEAQKIRQRRIVAIDVHVPDEDEVAAVFFTRRAPEMVEADLELFRKDQYLKDAGFVIKNEYE